MISLDFETHVTAHLKKELAEVNGKSTSTKKRNKKTRSQSEVDDDEEAAEDSLGIAPCVDDATDEDYVDENDDDDVEEIGPRTFAEVREGILVAFRALLGTYL